MTIDKKKLIEKKYQFRTDYIKSFDNFKKNILEKKIIPYQVEFQAPPRGSKICWLECPYCYGLSAEDTKERLEKNRGIEILKQILDGGVRKIIFAGYATDPLNCSYIEDLLELIPLSEMRFWLTGNPNPMIEFSLYTKDSENISFTQSGWNVKILENREIDSFYFPGKINISNSESSITILISDWKI